MKYKLIKETNKNYSAIEQILFNRGIKIEDIPDYLNTTDKCINSPLVFGEKNLNEGARMIGAAMSERKPTLIVIDADCDGYTSAALLLNYLHNISSSFVENQVEYYIHDGKQHGLNDCIDYAMNYKLVILPDSSSNDEEYHKILKENNIDVLVLDHHEAESISKYACIINNQLSDYPNKDLSGVGVTWQFCRYIDERMNTNYADNLLDLVALGLTADMMSLRSIETKHLINKGFKPENVKNPFIFGMWQKNKFKLGETITSIGAAFYIAPFVNAMVRSGTFEEKELLFKSMLTYEAFKEVPSTKRGHKLGEVERIVDQALRTCTNVKNRQGKAQEAGLNLLERRIQENNMLKDKVLVFTLNPGEVDRSIAGLVANKFMAKYQRPCCILTKVDTDGEVSYQGSARGYDRSGVTNFKDICAGFDKTLFSAGHQGAFGLGIPAEGVSDFVDYTNEILKDMSSEPVYLVDYIYNEKTLDPTQITEMADLEYLWGKDIEESFVAIEGVKITKDKVKLLSADKNPTLKISLPNGVEALRFGSNADEYESLLSDGYIKLNIVGKCNVNEWNGRITPQIMIEDYEILENIKYLF